MQVGTFPYRAQSHQAHPRPHPQTRHSLPPSTTHPARRGQHRVRNVSSRCADSRTRGELSTGDQNRRPIAPCCALLSRWGLHRARRAPKTPPQATSQAPQRRSRESKFLSLGLAGSRRRRPPGDRTLDGCQGPAPDSPQPERRVPMKFVRFSALHVELEGSKAPQRPSWIRSERDSLVSVPGGMSERAWWHLTSG